MKRENVFRKGLVICLTLLFLVLATACVTGADKPKADMTKTATAQIRNVIVFIGDGMGNQQRRIAGIVDGKGNPNHRLYMESLTSSGIATNHSADAIVTDSAASATALSTGYKTKNGMLAVSPEGKDLKTILEVCRDRGMSTGLISTVTIYHATPAGFGAHANSRKSYDDIAAQYLDQKIDLIMGGGWDGFLPDPNKNKEARGDVDRFKGKRKDGRNLVSEFEAAGYAYVTNRKSLAAIDPAKTKKLLGLFAPGDMAYEIDRNQEVEPSVAEMTRKAIDVLEKNHKGFFLMVEGGKIDWGSHGHDVAATVYDTIALDKAVKVAVDYAKKSRTTLVLVVNDHETGGLTITSRVNVKAILALTATAEKMASMISKDGANVEEVFKKWAGITDLSDKEKKLVQDEVAGKLKVEDEWGYGGTVISQIIDKRTGINFSTGGHSGTPVIVTVYGPGCRIFDGFYDQTDIPKKIGALLGIKFPW